jgi:hypothetical protein
VSPHRLVSSISHDELLAVAGLMKGFPHLWWVSGGWAIDAFLDRVSREHEDLEIGIARQDQACLHAHLVGWRLYKLVPRQYDVNLVRWLEADYLELPIHQIVARNEESSPPEFEFFLNEVWDGEWRFRIQPSIRRPVEESYLQTEQGIPVIAPEIQLLYKSRLHRSKDEHDFRTVLGHLSPAQRSWLKQALEAFRPGDPWLDALAQDT